MSNKITKKIHDFGLQQTFDDSSNLKNDLVIVKSYDQNDALLNIERLDNVVLQHF